MEGRQLNAEWITVSASLSHGLRAPAPVRRQKSADGWCPLAVFGQRLGGTWKPTRYRAKTTKSEHFRRTCRSPGHVTLGRMALLSLRFQDASAHERPWWLGRQVGLKVDSSLSRQPRTMRSMAAEVLPDLEEQEDNPLRVKPCHVAQTFIINIRITYNIYMNINITLSVPISTGLLLGMGRGDP